MSVLMMRLAGPIQSWGTHSRFTNRDTGLEPSRSGVIGLLCAALGRLRDEPLDAFLPLTMAVRVDREGRLLRDFQTAQNIRRADPTKGTQASAVSDCFYLADADFLVGLEGVQSFLERLDAALRRPVWPLFLGRKAFVPALPVSEGVNEGAILEVLESHPWRQRHLQDRPQAKFLRGVHEVPYGTGEPRQDVPLSFVSAERRFGVRHVRECRFPIPEIVKPFPESPHVS